MLETQETTYINIKHLKSFSLYTHSLVPENPEEKSIYYPSYLGLTQNLEFKLKLEIKSRFCG